MAVFKSDWTGELEQLKTATRDIVEEQLAPMINTALERAGLELKSVVNDANDLLQDNIHQLTTEVHNHRQLTSEEIIRLIDYAAERVGQVVDERLIKVKDEASSFVGEKMEHIKLELAQLAVNSRRALYQNLAISMGATFGMALVAFGYRKLSNGELDLLTVFRGVLLSATAGVTCLGCLKLWNSWRSMSAARRNAMDITLAQLSVLRPNGAVGPFLLALVLLLGWFGVSYLKH